MFLARQNCVSFAFSTMFRRVARRAVFLKVLKKLCVMHKPKELLWPMTDLTMNQSELEANTCRRRQARENAASKSRLVLPLIG